MSIQMIPLNKLRLSPHNVRKSGAEDNLNELVANIEAKGVLQNLIGGAAKKKAFFDIFAGGRRLSNDRAMPFDPGPVGDFSLASDKAPNHRLDQHYPGLALPEKASTERTLPQNLVPEKVKGLEL